MLRINYLKRAEAAAMGPLGAAPAGVGPEIGAVVPKSSRDLPIYALKVMSV